MSNLIINTAYFKQKVFVTSINLAKKPFLNITNMSVTGDISINNVTILDVLTPSELQIQNATKLDFNYYVNNNSTKIASSIGYSASATSATNYTLTNLTTKQSVITISNLNAGVYIFDYSYNINHNSNNVVLYQLYEYIDNTTTTTNLLTKNKKFLETDSRWATHPHQIHWEFLSETGIIGYSIFIIFFLFVIISTIKSLKLKFNSHQLSSMLFITASILPLIPTGSFFTTYGATLFWINFSVMISFNNK
jgi:hypothetical protein